jgi:DNA polymerase III epsilon subunit-like protein
MFIFLDTETTGTGPEDRLCQIAFKPEGAPAVCETFNPGMPISIDAMAIHHITNRVRCSDLNLVPYSRQKILGVRHL